MIVLKKPCPNFFRLFHMDALWRVISKQAISLLKTSKRRQMIHAKIPDTGYIRDLHTSGWSVVVSKGSCCLTWKVVQDQLRPHLARVSRAGHRGVNQQEMDDILRTSLGSDLQLCAEVWKAWKMCRQDCTMKENIWTKHGIWHKFGTAAALLRDKGKHFL